MKHPLAVVALAVLAIPMCASAKESKPLGLAVFGGYQRYAMSDVDDAIDTPGTFFPGATARADKIEGGAGFGAGLRVWPSARVRVALDVSRLLAKTTGSGFFSGAPYDGELSIPATSIAATLSYIFRPIGGARPGIGAGAGYYLCTGKASANTSGATYDSDVDASGFGFHGEGTVDLPVAGSLHAELGVGYRHASTTDVQVGGALLRNADGSKSQIDWSGVWGRAGLTLYLGRSPG